MVDLSKGEGGSGKNNTVMTELISSSSNKITDEKLEGSVNFRRWKKIVKLTLTGRNQYRHLTESKPRDDENWDVIDARILGQMLNSMESSIVDLVTHIDTVKELWEYLDILYSGQNNLSQIYKLSQEFYRSERKGRSITQYFADFERMYEELNAVLPISANVQQMQLQREQLAVMGFLGGLGSEYETVRSQILGGETIASLTDTFARVLQVSRESSQDSIFVADNSALVSQSKAGSGIRSDGGNCGGYNGHSGRGGGRGIGIGRNQGQQHGQSQPPTDSSGAAWTCHYCGKSGHIQRFCYKLHGRLGQQQQMFANTATGTDSFSQSSEGKVVVMSEEEFARYNQSQNSQLTSSTASLVQIGNAIACVSAASRPWIIDSGASDHMSSLLDIFSFHFPFSSTVTLANGSSTNVERVGTVHLTPSLTLSSVLYVPQFPFNFISVSKLTKTFQCSVTFYPDSCVFQDLVTKKTIGKGREKGGLYVLEDSTFFAAPVSPSEPPPLQVNTRRPRAHTSPLPAATTTSSSTPDLPLVSPPPTSDLDLPIAHRKGIRACTQHSIANFISYSSVSPSFRSFLSTVDQYPLPKSVFEALQSSGWRTAMEEELKALQVNQTWDLVPLPLGKTAIGCRWVYVTKVNPDDSFARLKARLVAKGYAQVCGIDYLDTFSPVAKFTSVRILVSLAATYHWPLFQLDVKNAFLRGTLHEEVYMKQPPGFVAQGESRGMVCKLKRSLYGLKQSPRAWFGRFSKAVLSFGLSRCNGDHSFFYRQSREGKLFLIVYVDDIIITGDDLAGIAELNVYLQKQFQTKDLGKLKYFLGIEVAQSHKGIVLSQRKYVLDLLTETGMLGSKPLDSPMEQGVKLVAEGGELFNDPERYRRLEWMSSSPDENLHLPVPNEFIPTDLSLKISEEKMNLPVLLRKSSYLTLWFKPDTVFSTPKAYIKINFSCPHASNSSDAVVLTDLFTRLLMDYLNEFAYYGQVAGLYYGVHPTNTGFQVTVVGYNHKLRMLLEKVIEKIATFKVRPERFAVIKEVATKDYQNLRFQQPNQQAMYYCSLILQDNTWPWTEQLEVLPSIKGEDLTNILALMLSRTFLEFYIAGNMEHGEAESIVQNIENILFRGSQPICQPLCPSQHPINRVVKLGTGLSHFYCTEGLNPSDGNSALVHYIQVHRDDIVMNVKFQLFVLIAKQPAFHQLRSVEQLGYTTMLKQRNDYGIHGLQFIIQSTVKGPGVIDLRVEEFLKMFESKLSQMTNEDFKNHVNALIDMKLEKHKNLMEEGAFYWKEISDGTQKFDGRETEVAALRQLTQQELLDFFNEYVKVSAARKKMLSVRVYGSLHASEYTIDKNQPVQPSSIQIEDIFGFRRSQPLCGSFKGAHGMVE